MDQGLKVAGMPEFWPPGVLGVREDPQTLGGDTFGVLHYNESPTQAADRLGAQWVGVPSMFRVSRDMANIEYDEQFRDYCFAFARTIAKMAFCSAVYYFGTDAMRRADFIAALLGDNDNIAMWVGGNEKRTLFSPAPSAFLVRFGVLDRMLVVFIRILVSHSMVPEYVTIIEDIPASLALTLGATGYRVRQRLALL